MTTDGPGGHDEDPEGWLRRRLAALTPPQVRIIGSDGRGVIELPDNGRDETPPPAAEEDRDPG
jgi:hypothetical protein